MNSGCALAEEDRLARQEHVSQQRPKQQGPKLFSSRFPSLAFLSLALSLSPPCGLSSYLAASTAGAYVMAESKRDVTARIICSVHAACLPGLFITPFSVQKRAEGATAYLQFFCDGERRGSVTTSRGSTSSDISGKKRNENFFWVSSFFFCFVSALCNLLLCLASRQGCRLGCIVGDAETVGTRGRNVGDKTSEIARGHCWGRNKIIQKVTRERGWRARVPCGISRRRPSSTFLPSSTTLHGKRPTDAVSWASPFPWRDLTIFTVEKKKNKTSYTGACYTSNWTFSRTGSGLSPNCLRCCLDLLSCSSRSSDTIPVGPKFALSLRKKKKEEQ